MPAVLVRVFLRGVLGVFVGVQLVAVRDVRVMAGFLVIARLGVFRRFAVVLRGFLVVPGGFVMVMLDRVFAHVRLLREGSPVRGNPTYAARMTV